MSDNPMREILGDLFGYLESLETQSGAILQYLKEKGGATDKKLAPYMEQATNASNVKWRAARVRMEHLLTVVQQTPEKEAAKPQAAAKAAQSKDNEKKNEGKTEDGKTQEITTQEVKKDNGSKPSVPASEHTTESSAGNSANERVATPSKEKEGESKT